MSKLINVIEIKLTLDKDIKFNWIYAKICVKIGRLIE